MRLLQVHECYCWVDYDGDGVAEYRKVVMIGETIFENEETDFQPLVAMSSILIPYKHNGLSIAEIVLDLQTLLTELTRQMLDNVYSINSRRRFIDLTAFTPDGRTVTALTNPAAVVVPVIGNPSQSVLPDPSQPIIRDLLPVIQDMRQATSLRTGISPENALDPAAVKDSTYGSFMGALERANERVELIARIMAETGIKQLYRKAHQLHRKYPDIAKAVKLRNKWVDVDPRKWRERVDVKVNVGLGFSNKQQRLTAVMQAIQLQQQAQPMGLSDLSNAYHSLSKFVEYSDLGSADFFFVDPNSEKFQPPQPQPDPDTIRAQSEAERNKAQAQASLMGAQTDAAELELKREEVTAKFQAEVQRTQVDSQDKLSQGAVRQAEVELKQRDAEMQAKVKQMELLVTAGTVRLKELEGERMEAEIRLKDAQANKLMAEARKLNEEADVVDKQVAIQEKQANKPTPAPTNKGGE